MRAVLSEITGRTSVPAVFIGGNFVGGCNDGGLGGVKALKRSGDLVTLLRRAGALGSGAVESQIDPVANLFSTLFQGGSGNRIWFGVLQQTVDPSDVPSDEVRAELRAKAATDLTNIDTNERKRRLLAGAVMSMLTAAVGVALLAGHAEPLTRFAIAPPLFLSYGFLASANEGL
eukprot:CAMPEP_0119311040 /NCGR_PEP_ID=MMETSP1333-20130426/21353_1 /TAXON_ID=418940 /ORGANISM="Scyphosphaera apsteinii, Strain RCC1455" /LENGTH=173 /DNA_ID=CAMNT_0007315325 /DNA_START=326 /DNA_END=847 /DNA_ORIENTATION=-